MTSSATIEVSPTARGQVTILRGTAQEEWGDGISIEWTEIATPDPGPRALLAWVILRVTVKGPEDAVADVVSTLATLPREPERMASVTRLLEVAAAATRIVGPNPERVLQLTGDVTRLEPIAQALVNVTDDDVRVAARVRAQFMANGLPWVIAACRSDWVGGDTAAKLAANVPRTLHPNECREQEESS